MIIKNGSVYQEDKTFVKKDLYIENGFIVESAGQITDHSEIDASDLLVLPGLIDIHSHGAVGHDFSDGNPEGLEKILAYEYANGITSYCPTSMTIHRKELEHLFERMGNFQEGRGMAHVAGINMEGPFLDASKKGAHRQECIMAPDVDFFRKCNQACGNRICLVTLAPDVEGAMEFVRELHNEVSISLGHTGADYDTAKAALKAGANHVTHLFNAMLPLGHRAPGLIGAAAEEENCMAELICDGIHVHESMVRAAFKLFPGRIVLISDSMRAAGMEDGTYDLGGQQVTVNGKLATLSDGTIAGSATNLYDCMRTAVSFGIPVEEAIAAATINPARSIGIYDRVGSLSPGKRADVILADRNLKLVKVI
ncbi:N-acetylglucosamine-6-phosphate deacetylase [Acetatifactor muris]|uniref:N-acetylglucosamine-6-phosphate deacetylase n=1 Tax=Acetatifactor muris TaxID=879566 RepID=A0A2K4ZLX7_9FIRM|nr:N-acetylglucosamine-6-phosphate deacetylase [Acetatifactor muris]MCR2049661.1 N-acetylglucosamine-6-phosphate deacetylase [Acetatifactor muris]SOY31426.1 N-acetylglucosamine-6-phosphate deacetylase [Acetatifactor muris]